MNIEDSKDRFHSRLLTMLDKPFDSTALKYIFNIYSNQMEVIAELKEKTKRQAEQLSILTYDNTVSNRKMVDVNKRQLIITFIEGSASKITINPCDGRVSLKISKKASIDATERYIELVNIVMKYDEFIPFTYRGKIDYCKTDDVNFVILRTETSKRIIKPLIFRNVKEQVSI
jgi:hypothetical protein